MIDYLIDLIKRRDLILFLGAGISIAEPSSLPGFIELQNKTIWALCQGLESKLEHYYKVVYEETKYPQKKEKNDLTKRFMNLPPEYVFMLCKRSIVSNNKESARFGLKPLDEFGYAIPNENHYILAQLLANSYLPAIFTTNFDMLIESAVDELKEKSLFPKTIDSYCRPEQFEKIDDASGCIIKLHGSISDPNSIIICLDEVGKNCAFPKLNSLKYYLENYHILFSGYRGADLDIFSCLATVNCKGIIWNTRSEKNILPKIKHLLDKQKGKVIQADLNKLFKMIADKLNLSTGETKGIGLSKTRDFYKELLDWALNIELYSKIIIMGDLWEYIGKGSIGLEFFQRGYALTKQDKEVEIQNIFLGRLAGIFYNRREYDNARNVCNLIMDNFERIPDISKLNASIDTFQLIGLIEARKDIKAGMKWIIQSLRNQEELEKADEKTRYKKGGIYLNAANLLYHGGLLDEAINYYKYALEIIDEFGDVHGRARILSNFGTVLLKKGETDTFIHYYKDAEYLFSETGNICELSRILLNLAIVYNKIGKRKMSKNYARISLEYFELLGDSYRSEVAKQLL